MGRIEFSRGCDFISDPDPITRELHKGSQAQLVYYHFNAKDSLAITPDKDAASLILYVLEGRLTLSTKNRDFSLAQHDSVLFDDIEESSILTAQVPSKCLGVSTSHTQHVSSSNGLMDLIETVEKKDVYTHGHSRRVCQYATTIALEFDPGYDIITLGKAADLHDIGKINVPIEILQKPGKLTREEFEIIKLHPADSYNMLLPLGEPIAQAAGQHHERLNGSGYPDGLAGGAVCQNARLIAIADVFDAMTCKRVYNTPISFEEAVAYLESCTDAYDQTFVALLKKKVLDKTLHQKEIDLHFVEA